MFVYLYQVVRYYKPIHLYVVRVRPCVLFEQIFFKYTLLHALGPPMAALASICIHFHDCSMPVSLSPPRPPITCLSTRLCVSLQTDFTIFSSFSKPQAWLRGAVVEIVQVCSFTFFRGLSFHNSTFSNAAVG